MNETLRSKVIHLAHTNPELRGALLPILKTARGTYDAYIKRHEDSGAKSETLSKGAWEAYHQHHPGLSGLSDGGGLQHHRAQRDLEETMEATHHDFHDAKDRGDREGMLEARKKNHDAMQARNAIQSHIEGEDHHAALHVPESAPTEKQVDHLKSMEDSLHLHAQNHGFGMIESLPGWVKDPYGHRLRSEKEKEKKKEALAKPLSKSDKSQMDRHLRDYEDLRKEAKGLGHDLPAMPPASEIKTYKDIYKYQQVANDAHHIIHVAANKADTEHHLHKDHHAKVEAHKKSKGSDSDKDREKGGKPPGPSPEPNTKPKGPPPNPAGGSEKVKPQQHAHVTEMKKKHSLADDDIDEMKKHKKSLFNPNAKSRMSDQQRLDKFLAKCKPETKKRMKAPPPMTAADFIKLLGVLTEDDEGEGGKAASARTQLIRLAHSNPSLRPRILEFFKEARDHSYDHEGKDFAVTIQASGGYGPQYITLYWPLENIGIMRRKVNVRVVNWGYGKDRTSRTAWAHTMLDRVKRASNINAALKILDQNIKEMKETDTVGYFHDDTRVRAGQDKELPVPSHRVIEDIEGGDITVRMNGRDIGFGSKSDSKKWQDQRMTYYFTVKKRYQKKVNSVRDLLEKARGLDQVQKILTTVKVPWDTQVYSDPMWS